MYIKKTALSSLFLLVAADGKKFWEKSALGIASAAESNGILGKILQKIMCENLGRKNFRKIVEEPKRKKDFNT